MVSVETELGHYISFDHGSSESFLACHHLIRQTDHASTATANRHLRHINLRFCSLASEGSKAALIISETRSGLRLVVSHAFSHSRDLSHLSLHFLLGESRLEIFILLQLCSHLLNKLLLVHNLLTLVC